MVGHPGLWDLGLEEEQPKRNWLMRLARNECGWIQLGTSLLGAHPLISPAWHQSAGLKLAQVGRPVTCCPWWSVEVEGPATPSWDFFWRVHATSWHFWSREGPWLEPTLVGLGRWSLRHAKRYREALFPRRYDHFFDCGKHGKLPVSARVVCIIV